MMKSYYATPERSSEADIRCQLELISNNPIIDGLMNVVSGLFAVLNSNRQILAVNEAFVASLGIRDINDIIGLRPGETLNCIHASKMEGGCGTTEYCPTCGAVVAIVLSLAQGIPAERLCAVEAIRNDKREDLFFRVRSFPVDFGEQRIILLFLQDITHQQKLGNLERVFFHDIGNMVSGLVSSCHLLVHGKPEKKEKAIERLELLTTRLAKEVRIQQLLIRSDLHTYQPNFGKIAVPQLFKELESLYSDHPAADNKRILYRAPRESLYLNADLSLLLRIVSNMITNALEASDPGDEVRVSIESENQTASILVWNRAVIPSTVSKRVFQRNFTTKKGTGRGLGTYSMKLLGEDFMGASVSFTSSNDEGTIFRIDLNCSS